MADIKTYEALGYAREEKIEEKRREGDMLITVKTVTLHQPIERVRGVIVPLSDDGGFHRESHGDLCLVTGIDENFLMNLRAVDFRNLSLGKDNRTYYVMNDGSEYDDDREDVPGDPSWMSMDDVLGEVTE